MNDANDGIKNDPAWRAGFNEGLAWAANWVLGSAAGLGLEVETFGKNQAMSLRAAMFPIEQQDFFEAVRNDPVMRPEVKKYWLTLGGISGVTVEREPWIRVEDGLPDDEIEVEVYNETADYFDMAAREERGWYRTGDDKKLHGITHWRDLVPPGKKEG